MGSPMISVTLMFQAQLKREASVMKEFVQTQETFGRSFTLSLPDTLHG